MYIYIFIYINDPLDLHYCLYDLSRMSECCERLFPI